MKARDVSMKLKIVGTGLIALDVVYVDDIAEPALIATGGTCGNVLTILSAFGWGSTPIARLDSDRAAALIKADMRKWGVDTKLLQTEPRAASPIIVERLKSGPHPRHSFSWNCPCCGSWLPKFTPLGVRTTERLREVLPEANVFFFDRAFPSAVKLAEHYLGRGAIVVFEPSAKSDPELFIKALKTAHIVKYADDRLTRLPIESSKLPNLVLEIQTLSAAGVRYRNHSACASSSRWKGQRSFGIPAVTDTAGSGDWFTAGMLCHLFECGASISALTEDCVDGAITFSQALAAWNCRYVGARGGMYGNNWSHMRDDVRAIMEQRVVALSRRKRSVTSLKSMERICPSCTNEMSSVNSDRDLRLRTS